MSAPRPPNARIWAASAAACVGVATLAYFALDRAIATYSHAHFHDVRWFVWLTWISEPLPTAAAIAVVLSALWRDAGGRSCWPSDLALRAGASVIIAAAIKEQLKWAFGRTWPETWIHDNPSYIADGAYGFHPFAGGIAYASFPSGHTTAIVSLVTVLWVFAPRLRWLWVVPAIAVPIGLLGADYHWLSDIIVGAGLGAAVGVLSATLGRQDLALR